MKQNLWVLEYSNGKYTCFLCPGYQTSITKEPALKFKNQAEAEKYQKEDTKLWPYKPKQYEFEMEDEIEKDF